MQQFFFTLSLLLLMAKLNAQSLTPPPPGTCDPATGLCTPAPLTDLIEVVPFRDDVEIIYVGDPMCSWCWGISPALNRLEKAAAANSIPYRIVLGGLRPNNSQEWNAEFADFLRHHWEEVNKRSGQPFGYDLLEVTHFQYNTEPSCRAVVTARTINPKHESRFFELSQHRFYVQNEDPNEVEFYRPICQELGIDFEHFQTLFMSEEMKTATMRDFQLNRSWGVTGYPTVIFRKGEQLIAIARGYAAFEQMWAAVEQLAE
ncbi:MAG: DsbA family protein [Bacteroidota bacterium]